MFGFPSSCRRSLFSLEQGERQPSAADGGVVESDAVEEGGGGALTGEDASKILNLSKKERKVRDAIHTFYRIDGGVVESGAIEGAGGGGSSEVLNFSKKRKVTKNPRIFYVLYGEL